MTNLCVGGPLHGLRRDVRAARLLHRTYGGPENEGAVTHKYDMRRGADGRLFYRWQMTPRWLRAGFIRPSR